MRRGLFLDRDGTVIEDRGYISDPEAVELVPGAAGALGRFRAAGFLLVVVSNQSGLAQGLVTESDLEAVHQRMVGLLEAKGVELAGARYCPHGPDDACRCRKPEPGLLLDAARELGIDTSASVMVGDQPRDCEAGQRAGCRTVALRRPGIPGAGEDRTEWRADWVARSWEEAASLVLGEPDRTGRASSQPNAGAGRS